ncbi:MAG: dihydrodipicolinate synthase family protein, partial [Cytophagales bacterium]|nr:dihydrodipicolinate synthase family protein [Cytophagales bacterium]
YAIGAVGVISVLANAFGDVFKSIKTHVQAEDYGNATAELLHLVDINPLMYAQSNPVGIKQVLQEFGVCENHVRLPLVAASQPLQEKIREALAFMRQYSL